MTAAKNTKLMNKTELRKIAITKRNLLTQDQIQTWSTEICNKIIASQEFQATKIIHIYKSFGSEVDTGELMKKAFETNKIVVVPEVLENKVLRHWQVFLDTIYKKDKFGIETPFKHCIPFDSVNFKLNDLIIIPIVAFDSNNNRIGYGKGFYDKFLSEVNCKKIGIAFDCQLVKDFEPDPWDITLDQIIQN
jgi:5-formyltetrahydrofolate cyclo-ligase